MGKNRELASYFSNKIWRTVVVAGAMLAVPACSGGSSSKPAPTAPKAETDPAPPPADPKPEDAPKPVENQATTEPDQKADEKSEADKAQQEVEAIPPVRPRGGGGRPTGRGFILS